MALAPSLYEAAPRERRPAKAHNANPSTQALASGLANGFALERLADPTLPAELFPRAIELIIAGLKATEHGQR